MGCLVFGSIEEVQHARLAGLVHPHSKVKARVVLLNPETGEIEMQVVDTRWR